MRVIFREETTKENLAALSGVHVAQPQQGDEVSIHFDSGPLMFKVVRNRFFVRSGSGDPEVVCFVKLV
jgi:hypothetical protein